MILDMIRTWKVCVSVAQNKINTLLSKRDLPPPSVKVVMWLQFPPHSYSQPATTKGIVRSVSVSDLFSILHPRSLAINSVIDIFVTFSWSPWSPHLSPVDLELAPSCRATVTRVGENKE